MMWIAVVAVVVVALGAVVVKLTWRPSADESHSVRNYQSALGTIEHLADRPAVRVVGSPAEPAPATPSVHIQGTPGDRAVPPVPVRDGRGFPDPDAPIVFDDTHPTDGSRRSAEAADGFRSDRARRQALQSMNHRPRRWAVTTVVVVVLAAIAGLAYAGSLRTTRTGHTSAPATTAATSAHGTTAPHRPVATRPTAPPRTTPTTRPTQIVALTSTAGAATYPVGTGAYQVTLSATGACWVDATNRTTGTTVFTGTMTAGSSQVLSTTGPMTVELGAATATMRLNGVPVVLPSPLQSPFTATFQPTATSTTSTLPGAPAGSTTTVAAP